MRNKRINEEALDVLCNYYYPRAKWLELNCNLGTLSYTGPEANENVNDPLMQHVEIYDCFRRQSAGFSNVLNDLFLGDKTWKRHHHNEYRRNLVDSYTESDNWDLQTCIWIMIAHRNLGSGASFLPTSYGPDKEHGYNNCAAQYFGTMKNIGEMMSLLRERKSKNIPNGSSVGNQYPAPKKGMTNLDYLEFEAPELAKRVADYVSSGPRKTHREVATLMNDFNVEKGHRRFKFQFAAVSFDLSDYHPDLVDPESHADLGANAVRMVKLLMPGRKHDEAMDILSDMTGGLAKDLEDAIGCDGCRALESYDPEKQGYLFGGCSRSLAEQWGFTFRG